MKKRIISVLSALTLLLSCAFYNAAETAKQYDPYAANTQQTSVDGYFTVSSVNGYTKYSNRLLINTTVKRQPIPIYIEFPSDGGVRIYSEKTGEYKPSALSDINYEEQSDGLLLTAQNGTSIHFASDSDSFNLTVDSDESSKPIDISSNRIKFGFSGVELKKIMLEMPLGNNETIYGTGERFNGFVQNGKRSVMWNLDAAYHGSNSVGAELWRGYKNVPILHSNMGYSLFYNSYYSGNIDIGYINSDKYTMEFNGPELDLYLWIGSTLDNIEKYTQLTGKSILPAKWAFRYLSGSGQSYWNASGSTAAARLENVINNYKAVGTPDIAAIYLEGVAETQEIANICNQNNVKYLRWNKSDPTRAEMQSLVPELTNEELPIVKVAANGKDSGSFIDFTHENAQTVMNAYLKNSIQNYGLRGGMLDFGELIQQNTLFANGKLGKAMHNEFSKLYAKGYYQTLSESLGNDFITFARAACAGTQSYTALFSGDQSADFRGLKMQLSAGLSVSSSGFSVWGGDLAGFEGTPTNEVYCRGMQFSTFQPLMRSHGTTSRFPWDYNSTAVSVYKKSYWLRENILNAIYSSAIESSISGLPMMRAFALEFPEQKNLSRVEDSYIFCNNFLVAPVLEAGATTKSITFPSGKWYGLTDGTVITGGSKTTVNAPITDIPVYLRSGAAVRVTLAQNLMLTSSMQNGTRAEALLVTPTEGARTNKYYANADSRVDYKVAPSSNGYTVTGGAGNQATVIIAYGTRASSVKVDGNALAKLNATPSENQVGYFVNSLGQTVIRLSNSGWESVTING